MSNKYPYQKKWEQYVSMNRSFWIGFICLIPQVFFLHIFREQDFISDVLGISILLNFLFIIINIFRFYLWDCPRCKRSYFRFLSTINVLANFECRKCGLPKYAGSTFAE